ncbi:DUF6093 family protein [Phycicoccus avicenniae]|uniref:DUF6093 family protein n=1 Tax=Phycicoccus avicenniae TaxID=2828860 RepID=UPI003D291ECB
MSPLPNTRVVPADWSRHHARAAAGGMNGRCRIYDPTTETTGWDDATESRTLERGLPVYADACRIQALVDVRTEVQADEEVGRRRYLVQLLFDAPPLEKGWVLVPYGCTNDPQLEGAELVIDDIQLGTERFTRDIACTHKLT